MNLIIRRLPGLPLKMNIRIDGPDCRRSGGFTLIELLVVMSVGLIVLAALYGLFLINNKMMTNEQLITDMQQNARSAMDIMVRELKMAGYNLSNPPTQPGNLPKCQGVTTTTVNPCRGIIEVNQTSIKFTAADISEQITYNLDAGNLMRSTSLDNNPEIIAGNITSLSFAYLGATNDLSDIREIVVTVTAATAKKDPHYPLNNGYQTYTLMSRVTPLNLKY